jgi:hypothetical protein
MLGRNERLIKNLSKRQRDFFSILPIKLAGFDQMPIEYCALLK